MRKYLIAIALVSATAIPAIAAKTDRVTNVPAATIMAAGPMGSEAAIAVRSPTESGIDVRAGPAETGDRPLKVARYD